MPPVWHRLDVGSLFSKSAEFAKAPDFTKSSESGGDSFISQYNQQATESIKNSIGVSFFFFFLLFFFPVLVALPSLVIAL